MHCVYVSGSSKPRRQQPPKIPPKPAAGVSSGFFSSIFSSFGSTTPRSPTPTPVNAIVTKEIEHARAAAEQIKLLEVTETNVLLSVFAVDINVKLDEKMRQELQRATKKNPPGKMRLELIYVSVLRKKCVLGNSDGATLQTGKDEYDASKKEDSRHSEDTGSIFQGLRADIEG